MKLEHERLISLAAELETLSVQVSNDADSDESPYRRLLYTVHEIVQATRQAVLVAVELEEGELSDTKGAEELMGVSSALHGLQNSLRRHADSLEEEESGEDPSYLRRGSVPVGFEPKDDPGRPRY